MARVRRRKGEPKLQYIIATGESQGFPLVVNYVIWDARTCTRSSLRAFAALHLDLLLPSASSSSKDSKLRAKVLTSVYETQLLLHHCRTSRRRGVDMKSVYEYVVGELSRGYLLERDEAMLSEKQRRVVTFMKTPRELEKVFSSTM